MHAGAGAYICGEETALLDSLEGYRGQPRLKPPFPAVAGLYGAPDGHQQRRDAGQRAVHRPRRRRLVQAFGPEKSPGPKIYSLSGHVVRPGQYEAPMGTTMRELLEMAGGVRAGPRAEVLDAGRLVDAATSPPSTSTCRWTSTSVAAAGSMLGTTRADGLRRDRLRSSRRRCGSPSSTRTSRCGKCTPCREGTYWLVQILRAARARPAAPPQDLDTAARHLRQHPRPLVLRARRRRDQLAIVSSLKYFRDDYVALLPRRGAGPAAAAALRIEPVGAQPRDERTPADDPQPRQRTPPAVPEPQHAAGRPSHCTIDGFEVAVPKGTLIIRAAEQLGIQIPRFCDHPLLDPVGACRQCLVEVGGPAQAGRPPAPRRSPTAWSSRRS